MRQPRVSAQVVQRQGVTRLWHDSVSDCRANVCQTVSWLCSRVLPNKAAAYAAVV